MALLGINAFFAKSRNYSKKSTTPAHAIMGRFQKLKSLQHRHLCYYIDIIKGKHDRLFVASEHYSTTLEDKLNAAKAQNRPGLDEETVRQIIFQVLLALSYMNENDIVHRNLTLSNILFADKDQVKLANWGLYYMTGYGSLVSFPIGEPHRLAPENIADGVAFTEESCSPKSDTWAIGTIIYQLITGSPLFAPTENCMEPSFNSLLQILAFIGHDIHYTLEESKFKDLEATDVELLKQKEVGVGINRKKRNQDGSSGSSSPATRSSSPADSPTPFTRKADVLLDLPTHPLEVTLAADQRNQEHAVLAAKRKKALEDLFFHGPHSAIWSGVSPELRDIISLCLNADPEVRVSPSELVYHPYFSDLQATLRQPQLWVKKPFFRLALLDRPEDDPWRQKFINSVAKVDPARVQRLLSASENQLKEGDKTTKQTKYSGAQAQFFATKDVPLASNELSLKDLFHFWKVCTHGDVENCLVPELKISPPIFRLPLLMRAQTGPDTDIRTMLQQYGQKDESRRYSNKIFPVPVAKLQEIIAKHSSNVVSQSSAIPMEERSLDEKEKDIEYQRKRVKIFRELLNNYPLSRPQLIKESKIDIPPVMRGAIWAAILDIPPAEECSKLYDSIDKESEGPADRQIELDIPRCHQYHELLSSPEGHRKFKRILKAWVAYNPGLSYWQGVDSLLAPFLVLNFDDEPRAFMCLQRMIEKYSKDLFRKDKTYFLQEHLTIFAQLLSYHDPELSMHLNNMGFKPDLYAIPWFITLFSHDFSIEQLFRLWDRLLPSSSQMPFYLGYAIMKQLREIILPLDFNACILLFSSLPSIDLEQFVEDAMETARNTPISITMPNYVHDEHPTQKVNERWWEHRLALEEMSQELFPRVSVMDLISSNFQWLVLDIRPPKEFELLSYPNSINVDPTNIPACLKRIQQYKNKHVVVIANAGPEGRQFANALVENHVPRVSLLNGGIDALVADAPDVLVRREAPNDD